MIKVINNSNLLNTTIEDIKIKMSNKISIKMKIKKIIDIFNNHLTKNSNSFKRSFQMEKIIKIKENNKITINIINNIKIKIFNNNNKNINNHHLQILIKTKYLNKIWFLIKICSLILKIITDKYLEMMKQNGEKWYQQHNKFKTFLKILIKCN